MNNGWLKKYKIHHIIFWVLVFALWFYLRYDDYPSKRIALRITFIKVSDLAALIYLTNYFLIPRLLYKKKYIDFGSAFVIAMIASAFAKIFLMSRVLHQPQ